MAINNWKIISRRRGAAMSVSEYIWRQGHSSGRADLLAIGYGNLPAWCGDDPAEFWRAADEFERRNGCACREIVVSLPRELSLGACIALIEHYIAEEVGPKPYQYAIHDAHLNTEDEPHPHAHILFCDRVPDGHDRGPQLFFSRFNAAYPERGGARKHSGGRSPLQLRQEVEARRKRWEHVLTDALVKIGKAPCGPSAIAR
jgi:hypothetical protein